MKNITSRNKKLLYKLFSTFICTFAVAIILTNLILTGSKNTFESGISVTIISLVILIPACFVFVLNPLSNLKNILLKMNHGNIDFKVKPGSNDEIGAINESLNTLWIDLMNKVAIGETMKNVVMDPLFLTNMDALVTYANNEAATFFGGYKPEEIINKMTVIELFGSDKATKSTIAGKPVHNFEAIGTDRYGNQKKILVNTALIKDYKGLPAGVAISFKDLIKDEQKVKEMIMNQSHSIAIALQSLATGDLTMSETALDKDGFLFGLSVDFDASVKKLNTTLLQVQESVGATASASNQISSSSEELAAGVQEQSKQTSELVRAIDEITKTILETTKNASLAADAAQKAGSIAKDGGNVVAETISGMDRIAEVVRKSAQTVHALGNSSDQIGEIIQVIDDIADQTNLLALNAAIEAARAGEQGRGFAVVADEVRKLAERTTKATKEIASMIKQIQKDTTGAVNSMEEGTKEVEKGKHLADKAGESLNQIIKGSEQVVDIITQVASASEEQSITSAHISKSIEAISDVTQKSSTGIQEIARASEDLAKLTFNLQDLASKFKTRNVIKNNDSKSQFAVRANGVIVKS
jgi:methyl-accepting chemotaxis protein